MGPVGLWGALGSLGQGGQFRAGAAWEGEQGQLK